LYALVEPWLNQRIYARMVRPQPLQPDARCYAMLCPSYQWPADHGHALQVRGFGSALRHAVPHFGSALRHANLRLRLLPLMQVTVAAARTNCIRN
jgi:hypothetical protein